MSVRALLGVLVLLLALAPVLRAEEESAERDAARAAVLIPWSGDAKTKQLGLSASATELLDLWLDFCRSKHASRTRPDERFQGVPHAEWGGDESSLVLEVVFVNLPLAEATLAEADAAALFDAVAAPGFTAAVRVAGDDDRWLRLWGVMLTTEVAERRADVWTDEAFTAARERVRDHLIETLPGTAAFGDGNVRLGSLESERLVWLLGIRAAGCEHAGEILTRVCRKMREAGSDRCARATSTILAGCPGPEAETFVIAEIDSGDWERQRSVLSGAGRYATPALLAKVAALARGLDSDERAQMAFVVLQRAGEPDSLFREEAAATLLALLRDLPDTSERRAMAAMALVQSGNATAEVVTWLKGLVERLEASDAHRGRIQFLERVIERAEAQVAAREAPDEAGE